MAKLDERDFIAAAFALECEVEAVKAVCAVEAPRGGFVGDFCVSLFEGHIFHKYTKGVYGDKFPELSYPRWTTKFYGKTSELERARLQSAKMLDNTAALMSTSWGRFQIMGFNFALCGFKSVNDFVLAVQKGEKEQLDAFVQYILHTHLNDELQERRWADFARKYNGPEYQKNQYDKKMEAAYKKLKGI
jgi:hypothetical protein